SRVPHRRAVHDDERSRSGVERAARVECRMTTLKLCGMTREEDLAGAADLGVDAVGFVLWPGSPRAVSRDRLPRLVKALPPAVLPVAVFVQPTEDDIGFALDSGVRALQVHGVGSENVLTTIVPTWIGARLYG